jgi:alcohol dehydrogenase (cytochrome c)
MRDGQAIRALCAAAMLSLAPVGCATERPPLPVTQESQPMQALNARLTGTAPAVAEAVTGARLVRARAEPHNWLTYYGAYDGQRYGALDQINASNVAALRPAWVFQHTPIGLIAGPANFSFEATPIVVDGVMYLTGPDAHVWALDAATGAML